MGVEGSKQKSTLATNVSTTTTNAILSGANYSTQRIVENYLVIWLDAGIDQSKKDFQNSLTHLRKIVNDVKMFIQPDQCIQFLDSIKIEKVFVIISGSLGQHVVPKIHNLPQVDVIHVFCRRQTFHEQWAKAWTKVNGVHTEIFPICAALQLTVKECNQDSVAMSFISTSDESSNHNLEQLEPSFMYTQIFKEILLEMEHDDKAIKDLADYCRKFYIGNVSQLEIIEEFENTYQSKSALWWYTRECFTYQMLNKALRTLEGDTIINMGFFMRDLHQQIQLLHQKQVILYHEKIFTVYRGQSLLQGDFEKLLKTKGGLIAFNNFLSTSKDHAVSLNFAKKALAKPGMVGVFFTMNIDPSISSAPFASIKEVSFFTDEEEILFSMHSVFRICDIKKIDKKNELYQAELKLTADDDQELHTLTERIRAEIVGEIGWQRLGILLLKISQFGKAEELYNTLLEQAVNEEDRALYYHHLSSVKRAQGDYEKAIEYADKALEIRQNCFSSNHPAVAMSYQNLASAYNHMGEYSKALLFHGKALGILEDILPENHPHLMTPYDSIGLMYKNMGNYSQALLFYKGALNIGQKTLPENHPDLALSYHKVAVVYEIVGNYPEAFSFAKKALEIGEKSLPENHSSLAFYYKTVGDVFRCMREYSRALSFLKKALEICQKALPVNQHVLAVLHNNIGMVHNFMGDYNEALRSFDKALEVYQNTLPTDHPDIATTYNNLGAWYQSKQEYAKALSYHEKALQIRQKTLPPNHYHLAVSYNNISIVYDDMKDYFKALSAREKALEIFQKTLSPDHPDWLSICKMSSDLYKKVGEHSKALSFAEIALEIREKTLSPDHPAIAKSYDDIGRIHRDMGDYSEALLFCGKALEIREKVLPVEHIDLAVSYNNMGTVYDAMKEYPKSALFYEKSLHILEVALPPDHPDLAQLYVNIAGVYYGMEEYSKALPFLERTLKIYQNILPPNHPKIEEIQGTIRGLQRKLDMSSEDNDGLDVGMQGLMQIVMNQMRKTNKEDEESDQDDNGTQAIVDLMVNNMLMSIGFPQIAKNDNDDSDDQE